MLNAEEKKELDRINATHNVFISDADIARYKELKAKEAEGGGVGPWVAIPDSQGYWWRWDKNPDMRPFIYHVQVSKSGEQDRYFIDYPDSRWCDEVGGVWHKVSEPATAAPVAPSPVEETSKPCDCEDACDDDMLCLKKGMYCRVHNAPIDPCPFCGTAPEETHSNDKDYFYVGCANEDCMVQPETGLCKSEEEARKAWNWKLVAPSPIPSATEQTFENWWESKDQYELARSLEGQDDCYECCKSYAAAAWNAAKGISR